MGLYNASDLVRITPVSGSSVTGLYAPDGSYNGVINDGVSAVKGLYHPCGALNITLTKKPQGAYAPNGSLFVVNLGSVYTPVTSISQLNYLLIDDFNGANGGIAGRSPYVGSLWNTTGSAAANSVLTSNELTQNATGSSYTTNDLSQAPGEIGCTFRVVNVANKVTLGGTVAAGNQFGVNIYPSGNPNNYQVLYTTVAGDTTLAIAATSLASAITANSFSVSNGITASANGTVVSIVATECPRVVTFTVSGGTTLSSGNSPAPTMANYPTGGNFLNGMLHFRLGVDGLCDWTFYNGGQIAFSTFARNSALRGLVANTVYTYRCCITPPDVWGGLWAGSTLMNVVRGNDVNIGSATYRGKTMFLENGLDVNGLFYQSAWAYQRPSIPLSDILPLIV